MLVFKSLMVKNSTKNFHKHLTEFLKFLIKKFSHKDIRSNLYRLKIAIKMSYKLFLIFYI